MLIWLLFVWVDKEKQPFRLDPHCVKNLESPIHRIRQDENKAIQQIEKQEISTPPGLAEIKMRYAVGNTCYQT